MDIHTITLVGGHGKDGQPDLVDRITLTMGQVVSVVGPTGSGKTTLINDLELFANRNTPTGRQVLINGQPADAEAGANPARHPIALITQHTNFLSDLPVARFLATHARIRQADHAAAAVEQTLAFANELTGEPIEPELAMTELSGGQTRALLIADAVIIGHAPVILLDEIENAGIHRTRAIELLRRYRKIFIFVTHDPRIALFSDFRVIMRRGAIEQVLHTADEERTVGVEIGKLDDLLLDFRGRIRAGERLTTALLEDRLRALGYID